MRHILGLVAGAVVVVIGLSALAIVLAIVSIPVLAVMGALLGAGR